jgi:hypothetical protein
MRILNRARMSKIYILPLLTYLSMADAVAATTSSDDAPPKEQVFNLDTTKGFTDYRAQLKNYAQKYNPNSVNEFCIIGYENISNPQHPFHHTMTYWKQGHKIIYWNGGVDMSVFSKEIDLWTDVVKSSKEVGTSTYLVTKEWVSDHINDCHKQGITVKYTVNDLKTEKTTNTK